MRIHCLSGSSTLVHVTTFSLSLSLSYVSTASVDGVTDVTTPPQSTPSLQDNLLGTTSRFSLYSYDHGCLHTGVCESETATVEEQKLDTTCTATNESTVQSLQRMDDTCKFLVYLELASTPGQIFVSTSDLANFCQVFYISE